LELKISLELEESKGRSLIVGAAVAIDAEITPERERDGAD
jgi:hypothetical protein